MSKLSATDTLLEIHDKLELEDVSLLLVNSHHKPKVSYPISTYHEIMDLINDALGSYVPGEVKWN